nr:7543_t:CDS:2 [Entrophospora candida]CAG8543270.1 5318_t:CDS:2 [Entrophospora candida]
MSNRHRWISSGFFGFSKELFSNIFDGGFDSSRVKTGSGVQYIVIASGFHIQTTCPSCNTKISSGNRCSTCSVIGQVKEKKPITIDISADKGDDAPYGGQGTLEIYLQNQILLSTKKYSIEHL